MNISRQLPSVAGISGGRTSAYMAINALTPKDCIWAFQNTGEESEKTLDFLCRIEDWTKREIVRLEWRPGPRRDDPPKKHTFQVVSHRELARKGEPFRELLECISAYRKTKDAEPLAPWAGSRLCTAYLKIRTQHRYMRSLGFDQYRQFVGLRHDEPSRIAAGRSGSRPSVVNVYPLDTKLVTKHVVMSFWSKMPFDLEIPEHLGNCKGCFMKDERDLATALLDPSVDAEFYLAIERDFGPMRRGRPSYEQVLAEAPERMRIRQAVADGTPIVSALEPRRHRLIVRQEQKPKSDPWSCSCEGAELLASEDDESEAA